MSQSSVIMGVEHARQMLDKTPDFYFLLFLCLMLGVIRILDPRYLTHLWNAFRNQTLSARQLKDQLESASLPSLLMNVFFTMIGGAYIYYLVRLFTPYHPGGLSPVVLMFLIIAGMMAIYLIKYFVIRFSGWAFKVEGVTEHYIFNVFLINKMIAVMLLPVTLLLAFSDPTVSGPIAILSFILIGFMILNRYTRSWQVFGSFFQYSKFHFFTYLCASEILPLAILMKLLVRELI
ncbi:MAG: DUF4271 domain-containing protein [Sphingobacteriales bacterium]|nr:MAG: DUF4271 domain-containing protein [Sphingobacteriales bacterium]